MNSERLQRFIYGLKTAEQAEQSELEPSKEKSTRSVGVTTEKNNLQNFGGIIMGRFSNRASQYPGRIKLTKVNDEGNGTIYDCVAAEGTVTNEGTPLNADTLNALEDDLKVKLYRHRVRLTGSSTNGIAPVGDIEVYAKSATPISSIPTLVSALGISSSTDLPVSGCKYSGNNTALITGATIESNSVIKLLGMYFGYSSGNGVIQRISVSVSSVSDTVTQVI